MKKTSRYNLSRIMTRAWDMYRANKAAGKTAPCYRFPACLSISWAREKESWILENVKAGKIQFEQDMVVEFTGVSEITLHRWTNYGHDRIYLNGWNGYYDINRREMHSRHLDPRVATVVANLCY